MNDDWIKDIQRLMSDHEVKAPDGLLDDIKAEMNRRGLSSLPFKSNEEAHIVSSKDSGTAIPKKASFVPLWRYRWIAAAAAVVIIAVPVVWKLLPETKENTPIVASLPSATKPSAVTSQSSASESSIVTSQSSATESSILASLPSAMKSTIVSSLPSATNIASETLGHAVEDNDVTNTNVAVGSDATKSSDATQKKPNVIKRRPRYTGNEDLLAYETPHHTDKRGFSVSAYYGGSSSSGNTSGFSGGMVMSDAEPYGLYPIYMSSGNSVGYVYAPQHQRKAHHKQPIKVGVSVGYQLNNHWRVNTGVTYSYLSSDFTADGLPTQMQKLHYVGIPLTASYSVIKSKKAEVYVTGGGEVEKLVKGSKSDEEHENEDVKESRPQWSVKAAVGGAYHFTPTLSVYAEPGVSYYFDNHSDVDNVYKDRKTSFSLNIGLRVNLNK